MRYLIYILLVFLTSTINAQIDSTAYNSNFITSSAFDSLSAFTKYADTKKRLVLRNKIEFEDPESQPSKQFPSLRYFIITLVILLLAFVIIFILSKINSKKDPLISKKAIEDIEDISEIDSDTLYNDAIKNGDLRLAIRMQFIKVLQILSKREIINWQLDKTNRDYYLEIEDKELQNTFRYLTLIYDNAWYGNKLISSDIFNIYNDKFNVFINSNDGE